MKNEKRLISLSLILVLLIPSISLVLAETFQEDIILDEQELYGQYGTLEGMVEDALSSEEETVEPEWMNWVYAAWQWLVQYGNQAKIMATKHDWYLV